MDDPNVWRWIWLGALGLFALGEGALAGSFFLLPFAAGALVAAILAFAGVDVAPQWISFVAVSAVAASALIPLRRRLDRTDPQDGIGARRLIGQGAVVLVDIGSAPGDVGEVRVGRETWRAESHDQSPILAGSTVRVVEVRGTAVIVELSPPSE
jgi:membrane protein implicated in regulation of membrane protease activity